MTTESRAVPKDDVNAVCSPRNPPVKSGAETHFHIFTLPPTDAFPVGVAIEEFFANKVASSELTAKYKLVA